MAFSFWDKVEYLITKPNQFFERVREEGIGPAIIFFVIVAAVSLAIGMGMRLSVSAVNMGYFGYGFAPSSLLLGGGVFGFGATFVYAGVVHLLARWMGGTGSYVDSYKAIAYSAAPALLIMNLPLIGLLGGVYTLVLTTFLGGVYTLVLTTFGIMSLHRLSGIRAAVAAVLPAVLVVMALIGFVLFLLLRYL